MSALLWICGNGEDDYTAVKMEMEYRSVMKNIYLNDIFEINIYIIAKM